MENKDISNWVRQSRYRARHLSILCNIDLDDVRKIIKDHNYKCAYCSKDYNTLDNPFPYTAETPCVTANILPICKECKKIKKRNNILELQMNGYITNERYIQILKYIFSQKNGDILKAYIKSLIG